MKVTWNGESRNIELTKAEPVITPPAAVTPPADTPKIIEADITVDGEARDRTIRLVEIPGEPEESGIFVPVDELLSLIQTKETPFEGSYDPVANIFEVTTKAPFAEGKPLREVLDATGYRYEVIPGEGGLFTIELTSGSDKATATFNITSEEPGRVVFGDKEAEFAFYPSQATTYIVEESFLQALKDIGFMK